MEWLKQTVKRTPVVRDLARLAMRWRASLHSGNFKSADYWESRYQSGRDSGPGSYNRLAKFKAETLNEFVSTNDIGSVIEFGCGDGSQLTLSNYKSYIGVDVAPTVLAATRKTFEGDQTKAFIHLDDVSSAHISDLSMSLDVIYHLVEDEVFDRHMRLVFDTARKYVAVYSSNEVRASDSIHVRHRRFTDWIADNRPEFRQIALIKNPYPLDVRDLDNTSFADFYFFAKGSETNQK